jgi:cyclase
MLKKRIIFKLLYDEGFFCISRNFRLQKVGDANWLFDKFQFSEISHYIDELVIINVAKNNYQNPLSSSFIKDIQVLCKKIFIPTTIGGGLRKFIDVTRCFEIGADKVLFNSLVYEDIDVIHKTKIHYGSQAISIGVDYKKINNQYFSYIFNASKKTETIREHFDLINIIAPGEIFLTSILNDGTGFGIDESILNIAKFKQPLVLAGGTGNENHVLILKNENISGIMTGNLFNFIGKGLFELRKNILEKNKDIPLRKIEHYQ